MSAAHSRHNPYQRLASQWTMIKALQDTDPMPFGKYGPGKGDERTMGDVPASYLLFLYDKDDGLWQDMSDRNMPLRLYVEENYEGLRRDAADFEPLHPYRKK